MIYLTDTFSFEMLQRFSDTMFLRMRVVAPYDIPKTAVSTIKNAYITKLVSEILGREISTCNEENIILKPEINDRFFLVDYKGFKINKRDITLCMTFYEITARDGSCNLGACITNCSSCKKMMWLSGN